MTAELAEEKVRRQFLFSVFGGIFGPKSAAALGSFDDEGENGEAPNRGEMSSNLEQLVAMADLF